MRSNTIISWRDVSLENYIGGSSARVDAKKDNHIVFCVIINQAKEVVG